MSYANIMIVNNTRSDLRMFHDQFIAFAAEGAPLHDDIADLFNVRLVLHPITPCYRVIVEAT